MGCEERERGTLRGCGRRDQGVELGNEGCVPGVRRTEREVQFAGLLESAPKEEDGFRGWGGRGDRELDVLWKVSAT